MVIDRLHTVRCQGDIVDTCVICLDADRDIVVVRQDVACLCDILQREFRRSRYLIGAAGFIGNL